MYVVILLWVQFLISVWKNYFIQNILEPCMKRSFFFYPASRFVSFCLLWFSLNHMEFTVCIFAKGLGLLQSCVLSVHLHPYILIQMSSKDTADCLCSDHLKFYVLFADNIVKLPLLYNWSLNNMAFQIKKKPRTYYRNQKKTLTTFCVVSKTLFWACRFAILKTPTLAFPLLISALAVMHSVVENIKRLNIARAI